MARIGRGSSAGGPAHTVAQETHAPQRTTHLAGLKGPRFSTVFGMPDDSVVTDCPPLPIPDELNIVQIRVVFDRRRLVDLRLTAACVSSRIGRGGPPPQPPPK